MRIGRSAQGLSIDCDDVAAGITEPGHEFLEESAELVRIQSAESCRGSVRRFSTGETCRGGRAGLGKDRHIHCRPAARQYGAERDHHHIKKILASGALDRGSFNSAIQASKPSIFPPPPRAGREDRQASTPLSKSHNKLPIILRIFLLYAKGYRELLTVVLLLYLDIIPDPRQRCVEMRVSFTSNAKTPKI
jgi:hypothetical protein